MHFFLILVLRQELRHHDPVIIRVLHSVDRKIIQAVLKLGAVRFGQREVEDPEFGVGQNLLSKLLERLHYLLVGIELKLT